MSEAAPFRVGLLGAGTVGGAFAELIGQRGEAIAATTGRRPELCGVLTRSAGDFDEILAGSDLVVELIGGVDPARGYVARALAAGRHVVTANKQLLSRHGEELFAIAADAGVQLRFEAAVGGVVPVIRVIEESLAGAHIERVHGIVNGTTNYILTEMARGGLSYDDALARAQQLGYAEADPTDDVSGADAAAKMAIITRLAFGAAVRLDAVPHEGIEHITADDIAYAREFDLVLKLVGTAERIDDGVSVRVFPVFLYPGHPLAAVNGAYNAVTIESPSITEVTLSGPGAGGPQTASAVLGDVVTAMTQPAIKRPAPVETRIVDDVGSAFYLHLDVADRPGVLAQVAARLGAHEVSVRSVLQRVGDDGARLVMVTHETLEAHFFAAVNEIGEFDLLRGAPRAIRVIEEEFG